MSLASEGLLGALADEVDRVALLALVQDFEVQVRSCGAAGVTHQRDGLAFLHFVADSYEVFGIVRVAGCVAIAVVDLDEFAISVTLGRPGNYAVSDGENFGARLACEVDAPVIGRLAGKWVRAFAEVRGHPAGGDGPSLRRYTGDELLVGQYALQRTGLRFPVVQLLVEVLHRLQHFGHGDRRSKVGFFRTAEGRLGIEVEFAVGQVRHLRQAPAERIEADHPGVHLSDPDRERIKRVFRLLPRHLDRFALRFDLR